MIYLTACLSNHPVSSAKNPYHLLHQRVYLFIYLFIHKSQSIHIYIYIYRYIYIRINIYLIYENPVFMYLTNVHGEKHMQISMLRVFDNIINSCILHLVGLRPSFIVHRPSSIVHRQSSILQRPS